MPLPEPESLDLPSLELELPDVASLEPEFHELSSLDAEAPEVPQVPLVEEQRPLTLAMPMLELPEVGAPISAPPAEPIVASPAPVAQDGASSGHRGDSDRRAGGGRRSAAR